ncbi:putative phosphatidate phosphatase isoform X1 [Musca domestica]|uniref:Phosphatidate phosphatase isoform X1 n=1 Tax=Musca domestica TaxID=7370 RepID=A0ABM3USH1_MUSDO|nr:putative phosphatidate phosphatase isoform X1 [Musca domestica]
MSNDSSASETTPLRRPEEESYRHLPVDENSLTASVTTKLLTSRNGLPVASTSHNGVKSNARFNTIAVAHHGNSSNNNTNHNIEVHLTAASDQLRHRSPLDANHSPFTPTPNVNYLNKMDTTNKRILCRIGLDVLILICVLFPILCFFLWGESYKRGFFCDDESLMHPFKESTINNFLLYLIGLVLPVVVIIIVEIIQSRHQEKISNGNNTGRRYVFMDYEIPEWLVQCYKKIGVFGFGAGVGQLTTDIAKYSIGRLRPHFFAVCQPIMADGTTCADAINQGKYITNFHCAGVGSSERMLKEVSLSFPSGHSSFTFYGMVYLAIYLQCRMTWRGSKLMRHFLQFIGIMLAWYTALSRVSDYKHHWSDVLGGSLIGSIVAIVVTNYVSDLFPNKSTSKSYVLPTCTRDVTPQTTLSSNGN